MNRRRYIRYSSLLLTPIPKYLQTKIFNEYYNIEKYHSAWNTNFYYNSLNINNLQTKIVGELQIHTINVAHGDSTLIITPNNKTILVDTGHYVHRGRLVRNYLRAHNIDKLDYLILTHPHWDHIGGVKNILSTYETNKNGVGEILNTNTKHTTNTYENYIDSLNNYTGEINQISESDKLDIDDKLDINILNPEKNVDEERIINDTAIVIHISYEDTSIILPSDIEEYSEKRLAKKYGDKLKSDIYKLSHHGNKSSSTSEFINAINPDIGIISSAYHSQFNHPHQKPLNKLNKNNIDTYWTGIHGSIVTVSNGEYWTVYPQRNKTNQPQNIESESQIDYPPELGIID